MKCRPGKCCQRYGDHQHQQSNGIECLWGARPVHGTLWFPIFLSLCHMTHEIAVSRWFMAKSIPSGSTKGKVKQFLARLQNFLHMKGNRPQPRVPRQDDHHRQHTIKPDDIGTRKVCLCCGQKKHIVPLHWLSQYQQYQMGHSSFYPLMVGCCTGTGVCLRMNHKTASGMNIHCSREHSPVWNGGTRGINSESGQRNETAV